MSDVATGDLDRAHGGGDANGASPAASITQVAADTARSVKEEFAGVVGTCATRPPTSSSNNGKQRQGR